MFNSKNGISLFGIEDNSSVSNYAIKTIEIGDWDMDTNVSVSVAHGLTSTEWKTIMNVNVIIRPDDDSTRIPCNNGFDLNYADVDLAFDLIDSSDITIRRMVIGSSFDNTNFNATSFNRGWITFMYKPD